MKSTLFVLVLLAAIALFSGDSTCQGDPRAGIKSLVGDLCKKLSHPNPRIRLAVREALRMVGRDATEAIEQELARAQDPHVKAFIRRVLRLVKEGVDPRRRLGFKELRDRDVTFDDIDWLAMELGLTFEQMARLEPILKNHVKELIELYKELRMEEFDLKVFREFIEENEQMVKDLEPDLKAVLNRRQASYVKRLVRVSGITGIGKMNTLMRRHEREVERNRITADRDEKIAAGPRKVLKRGLDWLTSVQRNDGRWYAGSREFDVAVTGLAALAFSEVGHSYRSGPYKKTIGEAIKYLRRKRDDEGCFGGQKGPYLFNHALATAAYCKAYGMTRSPLLKNSAVRGVRFLLDNRKGGWQHGEQPGDGDLRLTTWAVIALRIAQDAGIEVPDEAFKGAKTWFRSRTGAGSEMALATHGRMLAGEAGDSDAVKKATALLLGRMPEWPVEKSAIDPAFWHHGTLALSKVGGDAWQKWRNAVSVAVCKSQIASGHEAGSWDPAGPWSNEGGRVYSTALMVITCVRASSSGR